VRLALANASRTWKVRVHQFVDAGHGGGMAAVGGFLGLHLGPRAGLDAAVQRGWQRHPHPQRMDLRQLEDETHQQLACGYNARLLLMTAGWCNGF